MLHRNIMIATVLALSTPLAFAQSAPPAATTAPMGVGTGSVFATDTTLATQWRGSDLDDKDIYNLQNEKIGEIEDVMIDGEGRISAVIVSVGGFLGLGKKDVAIAYRALKLSRESNGDAKILLDVAKPALQSAPEFVYPKK